jgi:hypothetical protein
MTFRKYISRMYNRRKLFCGMHLVQFVTSLFRDSSFKTRLFIEIQYFTRSFSSSIYARHAPFEFGALMTSRPSPAVSFFRSLSYRSSSSLSCPSTATQQFYPLTCNHTHSGLASANPRLTCVVGRVWPVYISAIDHCSLARQSCSAGQTETRQERQQHGGLDVVK